MTWISVKDYLPKEEHDVLVIKYSGEMDVLFLHKNGMWYPGGLSIGNSSYWMELPNPPKDIE